jgi:hypothetical protein
MENNKLALFDSSLADVNRALITYKTRYRQKDSALNKFYKRDSLLFLKSIGNLEELMKTEDIDKDLTILLGKRIAYQKEQMTEGMINKRELGAILLDTVMQEAEKNYKMMEVNKAFNYKMENLIERIGRSTEDLAEALSKKYQYTFSMNGFRFYPFYLTLKKARQQQPVVPEVAPPLPEDPAPDLPD